MLAMNDLSQFNSEKVAFKILKPWWDMITDYLVMFLLMVSLLVGAMEVTSGTFDCLPAVECSLAPNNTLVSATESRNTCTVFYKSHQTRGIATVIAQTKDYPLHYAKYVNSECSKTAIRWFLSYFSFILFGQALILLILDNFWLKFPTTASKLETFSGLVVECYNSPGSDIALSRVLWIQPDTDESSSKGVSNIRSGTNLSENERLLDVEEQQEGQPLTSISDSSPDKVSVDVATVLAVKTLHEKVKRFEDCIKSSQRIWKIYLSQTALQIFFTLLFIIADCTEMQKLHGTMKCSIEQYIPVVHDHFVCSHNLAPVFEIALILFLVVLALCFCVFTFIMGWTIQKVFREEKYDFMKKISEEWLKKIRAADLLAAEADMNFLLQLLHSYNKLYVVRFAFFLSKANGRKLKAFILGERWPLETLERLCQNNERQLTLNRLSGIPPTIFDVARLYALELTRGSLEEDDFEYFEELRDLRKLTVVDCGLRTIPGEILGMAWLEVLVLKRNSIKSIEDGIWKLASLETLDVSENKLETIAESIKNLDKLLTVDLSNNTNLKMSAIKNVLACKRLRVLKIVPLTPGEDELTEEEFAKFREVNTELTNAALQRIHVIPYTPEAAPHIRIDDKDRVYKMDSSPKGIAMIINNLSFEGTRNLPDRHGSEVDVAKLRHLFRQIGFHVLAYKDLTVSEAREVIKKHATDERYSNSDAIVVIIMTHGVEDGIIFIDGKIHVDELVRIVQKSSHYQEKPKLFFIQTCRGQRTFRSYQPVGPEHDGETALPVSDNQITSDAWGEGRRDPKSISGFEPPVPPAADTLLSYSTLQGYVSFRNTKSGSWFVNSLVDIFSKYAWEEDILSLLTYVNYQVSHVTTQFGWRQIPAPQSTLTKKLYLLPGYPPRSDRNVEEQAWQQSTYI